MAKYFEQYSADDSNPSQVRIFLNTNFRVNVIGMNIVFFIFGLLIFWLYFSGRVKLDNFIFAESLIAIFILVGVYAWFYNFNCEIFSKKEFRCEIGAFKKNYFTIPLNSVNQIQAVTYFSTRKSRRGIRNVFSYKVEFLMRDNTLYSTGFDFKKNKTMQNFVSWLGPILNKPVLNMQRKEEESQNRYEPYKPSRFIDIVKRLLIIFLVCFILYKIAWAVSGFVGAVIEIEATR